MKRGKGIHEKQREKASSETSRFMASRRLGVCSAAVGTHAEAQRTGSQATPCGRKDGLIAQVFAEASLDASEGRQGPTETLARTRRAGAKSQSAAAQVATPRVAQLDLQALQGTVVDASVRSAAG